MPVMSGMEFLGAFNDLDYGHQERPRVVFCTTENSIDHIRAAIEAGADEYVMKPFDREPLEGKLQPVGNACGSFRCPAATPDAGQRANPRTTSRLVGRACVGPSISWE